MFMRSEPGLAGRHVWLSEAAITPLHGGAWFFPPAAALFLLPCSLEGGRWQVFYEGNTQETIYLN